MFEVCLVYNVCPATSMNGRVEDEVLGTLERGLAQAVQLIYLFVSKMEKCSMI